MQNNESHLKSKSKSQQISAVFALVFCVFVSMSIFSAHTVNANGNTALTCSSGPTCGLVGYWTLDGKDTNWATGSTTDRTGNGRSGLLIGMSTTTSPVSGKVGQALSFNGVNGYIKIPDIGTTLDFTATSKYTWSSWVKNLSTTSGYSCYLSKDTPGKTAGFNLCFSQIGNVSDVVICHYVATAWTCSSGLSLNIPTGSWNNLAVTYDGSSNWGIYRNGSYMGSVNFSVTSDTVANYYIGSGNDGGTTQAPKYFWNGSIDDVHVYGRILSASEILGLYSNGSIALSKSSNVIATSSCTSGLSCGLVGYWTFDGKDLVNNVADRSGSGNIGYLSGYKSGTGVIPFGATSSAVVSGVLGQAIRLNGISESSQGPIVKGVNSAFSFPDRTFTVSAWVKTNVTRENEIIANGGGPNGDQKGWFLGLSNKQILLAYRNGSFVFEAITGTTNVSDNRWHHVVAVMMTNTTVTLGNTASIYLDGKLVSVTNPIQTAPYAASTDVWTIGARCGGSYGFYNGLLDDIRVYNRGLSAAEINQLYSMGSNTLARSPTVTTTPSCTSGLSCGLVGYWTFDGKDTNWKTGLTLDKSGSGNTGQLIGMSTTTSPVTGKVGQGLKFDGVSSYVNVQNTISTVSKNGVFTASLWFKTNRVATTDNILAHGLSSSDEFVVGFNTSGVLAVGIYNGSTYTKDDIIFNDTTKWHHVVAVYNGTTMKGYLDGAAFNNEGYQNPSTIVTSGFKIGSAAGGTARYFNGSLDDVRIYNRALSAPEVLQLYNSGK